MVFLSEIVDFYAFPCEFCAVYCIFGIKKGLWIAPWSFFNRFQPLTGFF